MLSAWHFKAIKEIKIIANEKDLEIFIAAFQGELERRSLKSTYSHGQESSDISSSTHGSDEFLDIDPGRF